MKVYSPTQTQKWLTCPRLWSLDKEWRSKLATKRDVGAILGGGFAVGMNDWYGGHFCEESAGQAGWNHATAEIAKLVDAGIDFQNAEVEAAFSGLADQTKLAIQKFLAKNPIPSDWTILASELEMGEEKCRLDLGVRDNSRPAIIDFKVKRKLEARYRAKEVEGYRHNPQQLHYCWRYAQVIGEPILRYYIVLVSIQPTFQATIHQFDVPPKTLEFWHDSYWEHWDSMNIDIGLNGPPGNFNSCHTQYGPCEFQPACHEYHHDPELMALEYVRKERKG